MRGGAPDFDERFVTSGSASQGLRLAVQTLRKIRVGVRSSFYDSFGGVPALG